MTEKDFMWEFGKLPKLVIDMIVDNCKSLLDATDKGQKESFEMYSRTITVKQKVDGTTATADITVQFKHDDQWSTEKGFKVICKGSVTDGNKTFASECEECPAPLRGKGDFKDLVDLVENHNPTDFTYNTIEQFFESLRGNLDDMEDKKEVVA